jgi:hypothetical protein
MSEVKPNRRTMLTATIGAAALVGVGAGGGAMLGRRSGMKVEPALPGAPAIDPALIRYERVRSVPGTVSGPRHFALIGTERWLIAGEEPAIIDVGGQVIAKLPATGHGWAVTADAEGGIWLATSQEIARFDAAGSRVGGFGLPVDSALITALARSGDELFMADARNRRVLRCTTAGKLIQRLGEPGDGSPGFSVPSPYFDLHIAGEALFVANPGKHSVERYDLAGRFQSSWGTAGVSVEAFCGCCNPSSFALLPDGRFITAEKGLARIKRYSPAGRFECVVAGPDAFAPPADGQSPGRGVKVAADAAGLVHLLDPHARAVHIYREVAA